MTEHDGGRAFPVTGHLTEHGSSDFDNVPQRGMSLRAYAAVHLLAALTINPATVASGVTITERACELADALIARLDE